MADYLKKKTNNIKSYVGIAPNCLQIIKNRKYLQILYDIEALAFKR